MWSEHCSYKSFRRPPETFPTRGPCILQGPGENAGVVDIGDGLAIVFKMESHNHPSFIEPRQGAATGVAGSCRDIFHDGGAAHRAAGPPALSARSPTPEPLPGGGRGRGKSRRTGTPWDFRRRVRALRLRDLVGTRW